MGERLGNYELLGRIAMGGMAEIFRAKHLSEAGFEKEVVIKRILPHYADDEDFVRMFLDEAVVAAKLNHPNIVQIFDFKNEAGSYYIAMELVEGIDLKRLAGFGQRANMPLKQNHAAQIGLAMARGLGHAHERVVNGVPLKVVHRDVSPHNVLVSLSGDVKVMDFGIAKAAARAVKTGTGVIKGKIGYMSPEQARGEDVDHRTDIFATGIVLWEVLAGRRAFVDENEIQLLMKVQKGELPPLQDYCPELLPELAACIQKLTAVDKDQRYARMRDAERDLADCLHKLGGGDREPLDLHVQAVVPPEIIDVIRGIAPSHQTSSIQQKTSELTAPLTSQAVVEQTSPETRLTPPPAVSTKTAERTAMLQAPPKARWPWLAAVAVLLIGWASYGLWPSVPEVVHQVELEPQPPPLPQKEAEAPPPVPAEAAVVTAKPAPPPVVETKAKTRPTNSKETKEPKPAALKGPVAKVELSNCPDAATVFDGETPVGKAKARVFSFSPGPHVISVRSSSGVNLGKPTKLTLTEGELDSFRCD